MIDISLRKSYKSRFRPEFNLDIDLQLTKDSPILAIMGESGSGKTTILKLIAGLVQPDSGNISIPGSVWYNSEKKIDLPVQKRKVGFVFQDYALFPHMTVLENLKFAEPDKDDLVNKLLELTGISDLVDSYPLQLSGGQKQRIALIRSVIRKPDILLLDEPLSALDSRTREKLRKNLKTVLSEFKIPTLLVTHNYTDAEILADNVIELSEGKLVEIP